MAAARSSGGSAAKALSLRHAETFHASSFSTPQTMPQNSAGRTAPQQRHVSLDAAELSDSERVGGRTGGEVVEDGGHAVVGESKQIDEVLQRGIAWKDREQTCRHERLSLLSSNAPLLTSSKQSPAETTWDLP